MNLGEQLKEKRRMIMFDIVALGELLIDFTNNGISKSGMKLFEQNPGGAPANMLIASTKLGLKTAFIGKVGADMHGDFLKEVLERQNVDVSGLIQDPNYFTTLAFVDLKENGERIFSFSRKPGADTQLKVEELNVTLLEQTRLFHFGSLSLTTEPCRLATYKAISCAKKAGAIISYDPNYRKSLWTTESIAINEMRAPLPYVDIIKISDEETKLLTGFQEPELAAKSLIEKGIKIVVITLGANGAFLQTKEDSCLVPSFKSKVVDTTGAGDSFWGGFTSQLLKTKKSLDTLSFDELCECVRFANAVASICVTRRGAIPALPTIDEVLQKLNP